jgi:ferrous iron transport protein B
MGHFIEPVIAPLGFDWKAGVALISGFAAKEVVVSTLGVLYTGNPDEDTESLSERLRTAVRADGSPSFTPISALWFYALCAYLFPLYSYHCRYQKRNRNLEMGAVFCVLYRCAGLAYGVCGLSDFRISQSPSARFGNGLIKITRIECIVLSV